MDTQPNKVANRTSRFVVFVVALTLVLLTYSIIAGLQHGDIEYYFKEDRLMTYYSSFQLVSTALLCWLIAERGQTRSRHLVQIWTLMSIGFLFLAFDETLMIHENLDYGIHDWLDIRETGVTDRIDDVILLLYVLVGFVFMAYYRQEWIYYLPRLVRYELLALFLISYMIVADFLSNRPDIIRDDLLYEIVGGSEDIAKILAETVLLLAAYYIWRHPRSVDQ